MGRIPETLSGVDSESTEDAPDLGQIFVAKRLSRFTP